MTADNPTPEEWTKWQIDALLIYRHRRACFEKAFDEANQLVSRTIALKKSVAVHTEAACRAIDSLIEMRETLRERIYITHEYELAYEQLIITRDMSDGAFDRALAEVKARREADESQ